jgi:hypothetical protein
MSVTSILSAGAMGLGFLLAGFTYNLLRQNRDDYTPIYVFQFFCFGLVIIGASLQYFASTHSETMETLQSQIRGLQADLAAAKSSLPATQAELQTTKSNSDAALQKSRSLEANLSGIQEAMARIADMVPGSVKHLEDVNSVLTENVCPGGADGQGQPIFAGRGVHAASLSTEVIGNLRAAKSSIDIFLPKN